jgi:hypothetical protein
MAMKQSKVAAGALFLAGALAGCDVHTPEKHTSATNKWNLFQMVMRPELDTPRSTEAPNKYLFITQFSSEDACKAVQEHLMMSVDVSGHVFTFVCLSDLFHPAPESNSR